MSRALAPGYKTSATSISGSSPGVAEKRIFGMLSVRTVDGEVHILRLL
jgi:hypothetical protein